jgi:hypothetical protein
MSNAVLVFLYLFYGPLIFDMAVEDLRLFISETWVFTIEEDDIKFELSLLVTSY